MVPRQGDAGCRSRQPTRRCRYLAAAIIALVFAPCTSAFTLTMEYKPPVQSSVSKLRNTRFSSDHRSDKSPPPRSRTPTSKAFMSGALTTPPLSAPSPSFEERMRQLVVGKPKEQNSSSRKLPANVVTVETLQDYKRIVADERQKIVVTRFYARWCKACKAVAPFFYRMAGQFPNVVFVDVPVTEKNANLHQGLGVPTLPFGHIYHPDGGLVEELRMTKKHISQFGAKLQAYVSGWCDLPDMDTSSPFED